jgi:uncharacterized protein (TIGR00255 family)
MTIHSMTGYATATARAEGWVVSVEARSVNHRGLDTRLTVPRACAWMEPQIARMIRRRVHRGRVELRVELGMDVDAEQPRPGSIDAARFAAICAELRGLAASHELARPREAGSAAEHSQTEARTEARIELSDVLQFRHHFEVTADPEIDRENPAVAQAVESALAKLVEGREREGRGIARDLGEHLDQLSANLGQLRELLPGELAAFRARLQERVSAALVEFGAGGLDEERLAQELAFYADRSDISEELQRAASHIERLRGLLTADSPAAEPETSADADSSREPLGKTVDFYLQELIRETNTMGSKSSSARGTDLVIAMKSIVERMREQAANIE